MNNTIENGLIAAVLLIIIFVPIYLSIRSAQNKKKKKMMNELYLLQKHHNLSLETIEQLDSFSIVIDKLKKLLVLVNLNDYESQVIDLKNVGDCVLEEKKQGNTVQLLQLVLFDKKKQPLHQIVFYKQYVDNEGKLKRTTLIAEQWTEMVKAVVADRKPFLILDKAN